MTWMYIFFWTDSTFSQAAGELLCSIFFPSHTDHQVKFIQFNLCPLREASKITNGPVHWNVQFIAAVILMLQKISSHIGRSMVFPSTHNTLHLPNKYITQRVKNLCRNCVSNVQLNSIFFVWLVLRTSIFVNKLTIDQLMKTYLQDARYLVWNFFIFSGRWFQTKSG